MKRLFKILAGLTLVLTGVSTGSAGILVLGSLLGGYAGLWIFWYLTLYATFATLISASMAALVFIVEYGMGGCAKVVSAVKSDDKAVVASAKPACCA